MVNTWPKGPGQNDTDAVDRFIELFTVQENIWQRRSVSARGEDCRLAVASLAPEDEDAPTLMLESAKRRQVWLQGALGVFGAVAWLIAMGKLTDLLSHPREGWQRMVFLALALVGLALSIFGVWRLSVARDKRWDGWGVSALGLILVPGIPILFLLLFLVVMILSPPGRIFGD
jgi:hypothetical protein